jgi:DNA mismatch endonuclease (patch repair protein)
MDTLTKPQRSDRMRRIRSHDTGPERRLRALVWSLGYRYRKHRRHIIGNPDIAFIGKKSAIFLHGCFWHRHDCPSGGRAPKTRKKFWLAKFKRNVERDAAVRAELKAAGWKSLVVWECQLKNPSRVERRVRKLLDA